MDLARREPVFQPDVSVSSARKMPVFPLQRSSGGGFDEKPNALQKPVNKAGKSTPMCDGQWRSARAPEIEFGRESAENRVPDRRGPAALGRAFYFTRREPKQELAPYEIIGHSKKEQTRATARGEVSRRRRRDTPPRAPRTPCLTRSGCATRPSHPQTAQAGNSADQAFKKCRNRCSCA